MRVLKAITGILLILMSLIQIPGLLLIGSKETTLYMKMTHPLIPFLFFLVGIGFLRKRRPGTMDGLVYAETPRRALAILIDAVLIIVPSFVLQNYLVRSPRILYAIYQVISFAGIQILYIYFLAKFGATPGKMAAGICVIKTNMTPIGFKEAVIRSSVTIGFGILVSAGTIATLYRASYAEFQSLGLAQGSQYLMRYYPIWHEVLLGLQQHWLWSELVVMMFNPQRRAIHDYMAGTIVVVKDSIDPNVVPCMDVSTA